MPHDMKDTSILKHFYNEYPLGTCSSHNDKTNTCRYCAKCHKNITYTERTRHTNIKLCLHLSNPYNN